MLSTIIINIGQNIIYYLRLDIISNEYVGTRYVGWCHSSHESTDII